jgi:hypothetical protein
MNPFLRRGWSPATPCPEYEKFQRVAEELVANIGETASLEQLEQVQKSLLFLYFELTQRKDPLHPRFPGGHRCLDEAAYLLYAMKIRNKAIRLQPAQPPEAPPAPTPQPLSDEELLDRLKTYVAERTKETFFGQEQEAEQEDEEEESA